MHRVLLAGLMTLVAIGTARAGANSYFTETFKDFGITPRGPMLVHYFAVKNTSSQPVTMGQPRVSCGCVSATILKPQLAPGESTAVVVYMDTRRIPQAYVTKSVTVYVPFLSPVLEEVSLRVQAIARDDLVLTPDTLAIGTVRKGEGGKATVRLTLHNDPNWQVTEATSSGAYVLAAAKQLSRAGSEVSYEVTATLKPDCPVGNWTADVWLKTTTPGMEKLRVPVTVTVIAPIAVNPEAVTFGTVKVGATGEQKVILQGTQPFKVTDVKKPAGVEVSGVTEAARPVHVLRLTYTPKDAGAANGTIEFVTDHKEQPKVTVPWTAIVTK
jgi:hypothetical protein